MTIDESINFIYDSAQWGMIPSHMHQPLKDWIENGWMPGSFLQAILEHDIYGAVFKADSQNIERIAAWVQFICWYIPAGCHGSLEKVKEWNRIGGLRGMEKSDATVI